MIEEQNTLGGGRNGSSTALMEVEHLRVLFPIKSGLIIDRTVAHVHAVDDVSFSIAEGETLGVVGESGCGKTTLIRTLVRLINSTSGQIKFRDQDITKASRRSMRPIRVRCRWCSRIRKPR